VVVLKPDIEGKEVKLNYTYWDKVYCLFKDIIYTVATYE
jgi:hypothetical protein